MTKGEKKMKGMIPPLADVRRFSASWRRAEKIENAGIEYLHIDIMDGEFVPNFALGTDFVKKPREAIR